MKKQLKILSVVVCICAVALSVLVFNSKNTLKINAQGTDFDCEYGTGDKSDPFTQYVYGSTEIITYTEEEARLAGVPEGFSGQVLKVVSNVTNRGITLDFSAKKIPTHLIESITFRVYVGGDGNANDDYPEVRIPRPMLNGAWVMRNKFSNKTDSWQEIVLKEGNGTFFEDGTNQYNFGAISKDGYLYKFELAVRHNGSKESPFYIDSVRVKLIENEGVAPVITYNGEDTITIAKGQELGLSVSATDEIDGKVDVDFVWGDTGKIESDGTPMVGTHTLTFVAKDYFGNTATKQITVIVLEPDFIPPVFEIPCDTIYAKIGAKVLLSFDATDDINGKVEVKTSWSEGAIDKRGRLTEGTHVLTLTATDLSGNKTVKTITFIVTEEGDVSNKIVDEEELCSKEDEPLTSEPSSESTISSEQTSQSDSQTQSSSVQNSGESKNSGANNVKESVKKGCKGTLGGVAGLSFLIVVGYLAFKKKR